MTAALLDAEKRFDADSWASWLADCVDLERDGERCSRQLAAMGKPFVSVASIARLPRPETAHSVQAASKDIDTGDTITLTKAELGDMIAVQLGQNAHAGDAGSEPLAENAYRVWNTEKARLETITLEPLEDSEQ